MEAANVLKVYQQTDILPLIHRAATHCTTLSQLQTPVQPHNIPALM